MFLTLSARIFGTLGILMLLWILADGIFNDLLANTMVRVNSSLYYFLRDHKFEFITFVFAMGILAAIAITIQEMESYIRLLLESINKVFNKNDGLIELPQDFKQIEGQLNEIKFNALKNEQREKEEEQRKNDLVVYLAHDLKTPLTSVIGYLTFLCEEEDLSEQQKNVIWKLH